MIIQWIWLWYYHRNVHSKAKKNDRNSKFSRCWNKFNERGNNGWLVLIYRNAHKLIDLSHPYENSEQWYWIITIVFLCLIFSFCNIASYFIIFSHLYSFSSRTHIHNYTIWSSIEYLWKVEVLLHITISNKIWYVIITFFFEKNEKELSCSHMTHL